MDMQISTSLSRCFLLAEMVGFEPTCPIKDKTISSRSRYDRFATSPKFTLYSIAKKPVVVNTILHVPYKGAVLRPESSARSLK